VILDSGTTVLATVPYINRMPSMNIMSCSLDTFEALDGNHHQVFLTGGRKREKNRSLVGFGALESIRRFHGDICLMGTAGLKDITGLTSHSYQEIELKQAICQQCDQVIVLADPAKFRESGLHQWADWADVDLLVTGPGVSPAALSDLEEQVRIIQCAEDLDEQ
jgi:DeoR/GlpR family transcriptional regulator of sugar metabolism